MRRLLIAVAALLGLAAAFVAALPWLADPMLRAGLRLAAPDVDFDRLRLGWERLELEGVTLGRQGQETKRLRVAYRLPDLLDGRVERVEIEGLVLRGAWRDGRLRLAGLDAGVATDADAALPLPDLGQVVLQDARLELSTGLGTLLVPFSAHVQARGERLDFNVTVADARLAGIGGRIAASGAVAGDVPRAAPLTLDQANLEGDVAVITEQAKVGSVQDIAGEASIALRLAEGRLEARASIADAAWQGGMLGEATLALVAEGDMEAAGGTLDVALIDVSYAAADLTLAGAAFDQRLDWRYAAGSLIVHANEPGALAIERLTAADLRAGPLRLRLEPGERPLFELAQAEEQPAWRAAAAAAIEALPAHLSGPAALDLQSEAGVVTLTAEGTGATLAGADVSLAGGELRVAEPAVALEGIAAEVAVSAAGLAPDRAVPISVERIGHAGRPAWFAPLSLQLDLLPAADGLAFEASLTPLGGGPALELRGTSGPGDEGRATVELGPVTFGSGLQPGELVPVAADLVSDVAGRLALDGELRWGADGLTGEGAILAEELALSAGPARLERVNGVVRLDGLWPPTTPPGQQLAIGLLDLGLPLTAGITTFQLLAGPRLEVEQLEWRLAGGTARAEPFSLGSPLASLNVTLRAERLELGQLLALTRLDGLSGEGSLDGVLPLRLADGVAIIEGGRLAASGPGVLRYAAGAAPDALRAGGEGVGLLLQALENFHYEALEITLDGRTDAAMDIALHLAGANPDLYDGHPVEFNLDLEGELGNILRQGVASWQIPERIRERMQGFGR